MNNVDVSLMFMMILFGIVIAGRMLNALHGPRTECLPAPDSKRTSYTWDEFMKDIETGVSIDEIHARCKEFGMPRRPVTTSVPYQWIGTNVPFVGFNTPWTPSITTISSASTVHVRFDSSNQ